MELKAVANKRIGTVMFALCILLFAFAPAAWQSFRPYFLTEWLISDTPRDDYLSSLRTEILAGCLLLRETRPDILVLGDSHAYAGFDLVELERQAAGRTVSHCAIGGAFLETFDQWLTYLETGDYRPQRIVLGTSLRMFAFHDGKETRRQVVDKFLFNDDFRNREISRWIDRKKRGHAPFGATAEQLQSWIMRDGPRIEIIDEMSIEKKIQISGSKYFINWLSVKNRIIVDSHDIFIKGICARLSRLGIKLSVIHVPISPRGWRAYQPSQVDAYTRLLGEFKACADTVLDPAITQTASRNRDFINRYMAKEYDYDFWKRASGDFEVNPNHIFDLDHMSPLGARRMVARYGRELLQ